jgi:hypothetical protein
LFPKYASWKNTAAKAVPLSAVIEPLDNGHPLRNNRAEETTTPDDGRSGEKSMAAKDTFTIRRAFLVPLGLLLMAQIALLAVGVVQGQTMGRTLLLGAIVFALGALFSENLFRRIELDDETITVWRLFRKKNLRFGEITALEAVALRGRVFFTLWRGEEFLLITNAYGSFPDLAALLVSRVPGGAVSEEAGQIAGDIPRHNGPIFIGWVAVVFSFLILWRQLTVGI